MSKNEILWNSSAIEKARIVLCASVALLSCLLDNGHGFEFVGAARELVFLPIFWLCSG